MDLVRLARWTLGSALLLTGTMAVSGCSDPDALGTASETDGAGTESDSGGEPSDTEDVIAALAATQCSFVEECGCVNRATGETCNSEVATLWQTRLAEGEARELTFDPTCLQQTLARMEQQECRFNDSSLGHVCESFCAAYSGDLPLGAACTSNDPQVSDCAPGLVCSSGLCEEPCNVLTGITEGATCRTGEMGEQFEDCAGSLYCDWETALCTRGGQDGESCEDDRCGDGLDCVREGDVRVCRPYAIEGETCGSLGCASGLWCDYDINQCRGPAQLDETCGLVQCDVGLVCGFSEQRCVIAPPVGAECLSSQCEPGAVCNQSEYVCVSVPGEGQPCVSGVCANGLWCDEGSGDGLCRAPLTNGEACGGHAQCESRYCPAASCLDRPVLGEDCTGANVCARGLVCNGTTCIETDHRAPAACVYPGW